MPTKANHKQDHLQNLPQIDHHIPNQTSSQDPTAVLSLSSNISGLPLLIPQDSSRAPPTLVTALTPPTQPEPRLTYIDSSKAARSLTVSCLPLVTHIQFCVCGELFSYDLSSLQPDPQEIIELLKCTGSERGNWMIVGATYRRNRNPHAAITVLHTMLEGRDSS